MPQTDRDARAKSVAMHMYEREGTSHAWDLKFLDAGEGWARASLTIRADMLNGHEIAHGGMIFSLADTAFAWACNSRNEKTVAQHASITFLRPAKLGETLIAEAREDAAAGRSGVYSVRVTGEDDSPIAVFQGLSRTIGGEVIDDAV